ncbi:MAG: DUF6600 domain-containing protein [Acidobacteriota bacterium]
MKKATVLMVAFLVSIPLGLAAQSAASSDGYYALSYARLNCVNGDVSVQRAGGAGLEKADLNLVLVRGDKLGTGAGQAEIQLGRRNYLRLGDNTRVEFAVLPVAGDDRIKIHVLEGSAYLRVGELLGDKAIEIHTPDASAYILEEGLYRFNVNTGGRTEIIAVEGSLEAAGEEGSLVVRGHQSLFASDGRLLGEPSVLTYDTDEFDHWNESRDALFAQRNPTRYLPSDLNEYEEELDQNGRWAYEQPYGYVWMPYGVDDEWRPYMYGRWDWNVGLGWNWISSEPWGWSVYHYGRWHWRIGLGWYWIPRLEWGPAWVHWWWDNDYIGWCPLSWYDRPVVIMGNNFYDRYRDNYFPGGNRAMSVIHRDQLRSPDVGRHMLRGGELNRINRVQLQARQPDGRQAIDRGSLRAPDSRGVVSSRSGLRNEARTFPSGNAISPSRLRGETPGGAARSARVSPSGSGGRSVVERPSSVRPSARGNSSSERSIRTYPRNGSGTLSRGGSVYNERSVKSYGSPRSSTSGSGAASERGVRTFPSRERQANSPSSARTSRSSASSGSSWTSRPSSSGQSQSPRYNPRTYSYSGPSVSSSSSRAREPRYSAPSQSRGSYSAPSRSGSSHAAPSRASGGGRSSGGPRVSGSSSSSRSSSPQSSPRSSSSSSGHSATRRK